MLRAIRRGADVTGGGRCTGGGTRLRPVGAPAAARLASGMGSGVPPQEPQQLTPKVRLGELFVTFESASATLHGIWGRLLPASCGTSR